jgi:hypothetical protein
MKRQLYSLLFFSVSIALFSQGSKNDNLNDPEKSNSANQEYVLTATLKSSSRLFESKEDLTSVILVIPSGSVVKILGSDSTFYHVAYGEDAGYINKSHAVINKTPMVMEPVTKQPEQADNTQPEPPKEVTRLSYLQNKYGPGMAEKLYAGKIWRGMTSQMVRDSWGVPLKVSRYMEQTPVKEEWYYNKAVLVIENNTLIDWREARNN